MIEPRNKDFAPGNEGESPAPTHTTDSGDSAESIKDAHATGIGSLGRNDEKLDEENKMSSEDSGIIKD